MKHRGLTIALAVLLAVVGTAGVLVYVSHANSRAIAGQKAVTVVIAEKLIPTGTSADAAQQQGLLGSETLPAASVPADAVTAVTADLSGLVTSSDVQPGQLLLRQMLVAKSQATGGLVIPPGMVAVSVLFCLPEAVAGNVRAGSQVAVFDTLASGSSTMTAQSACTGPHQWLSGDTAVTRLVLAKVTVLAVGQASSSTSGSTSGGSGGAFSGNSGNSQNTELVTMAVSQNDAERLILMTQDSLPYLALVNSNSVLTASNPGVSAPGR
jgi:pilus assembly protein CpaB